MFIEILFDIERERAEFFSDCLVEQGALSASIEDADAGTTDEEALFGEPGGEPVVAAWRHSRIVALFDADAEITPILTAASTQAQFAEVPTHTRREVRDADWVRLTQSQFDPIDIGGRIWIVPSWHVLPADASPTSIQLKLDPGLAFGTGSHPTTRLCLLWLSAHVQPQHDVIDYGCGSGILAIAAEKLGAKHVIGTDIDLQAITAARANALDNDCVATFVASTEFHAAPVDIVVANILSNPLKLLAPLLCGLVAPGGRLVLSGVLERQWQEVAEVYRPLIALEVWRSEDGWVCLHGQRTHTVR